MTDQTETRPDTTEPSSTSMESDSQSLANPETVEAVTEQRAVEQEEGSVKPVAAKKAGGRWLAGFALLSALAAAAGVAYLYYLLIYLQPVEKMLVQNAQLSLNYEQLQQEITTRIKAVESATDDALLEMGEVQSERLASTEAAVLKSLQEALQAAPPGQREWRLAEAEYLLRIANHRILMEQDSNGALILMQAVDGILAELDDFALHEVRARLADEIVALRQVPRDDLQGVYLRIEAIKSQLDNLPLPAPEHTREKADAGGTKTIWQTLFDELKSFVRIRPLNGSEALQPLLAPEEVHYLELNLRLALEQAQLATLKRQQDVFEQSLLNVRRWLVSHTDVRDMRAKALLESVDELLILELDRPLPEISGSLNALLALRRSGS